MTLANLDPFQSSDARRGALVSLPVRLARVRSLIDTFWRIMSPIKPSYFQRRMGK